MLAGPADQLWPLAGFRHLTKLFFLFPVSVSLALTAVCGEILSEFPFRLAYKNRFLMADQEGFPERPDGVKMGFSTEPVGCS